MGRPNPNVLLVETFRHNRSGEHVDEVRFHEPVVISAVEILDLHAPSQCKSVSLCGVSRPQTFSLEIFVRNGGDTRFKRLCHPFLYSSSEPPLRDMQIAVTDHLVLRGTYDSLTMVLYGNSSIDIGQLSGHHELDSSLLASANEASCRIEDLPDALQPQREKFLPLTAPQNLHLVHTDAALIVVVQQFLELAEQVRRSSVDVVTMNKLVKTLVSAVTSIQVSDTKHSFCHSAKSWSSCTNMTVIDGQEKSKVPKGLLGAQRELQELQDELRYRKENKSYEISRNIGEADREWSSAGEEKYVDAETPEGVLEFILKWIQDGIQPSEMLLSAVALLPVKRLIGGLAAAQLLCTDPRECYRFVAAGGMRLLTEVIQQVSVKFSITTLLALGVVECVSRHAFGCESLLGWWIPPTANFLSDSSTGYAVLVNLLLQPHLQHVANLATRILHRLRAYELTAVIQSTVELIIEESASMETQHCDWENDSKALSKALGASKLLLNLLNNKSTEVKGGSSSQFSRWLMLDVEDVGILLPPNAAYGATALATPVKATQDIDPYLLSLLQERRFLPLLAALVSAPRFRSSRGQAMNLCVEFVGVIEAILLALLSCRSGVLFLTSDNEAAAALLDSFQRLQQVHEKDLPPLRHSIALISAGFLCRPRDIGAMLQTCSSVINAMDRLLSSPSHSDDRLWALWDLCKLSRQAIGKQAILMMTWFPEVIQSLTGALSGPESDLIFGETWKRSAVHLVAKVFQVLVSDPAASSVAAWIPHAGGMHRALLPNLGHVECTSGGSYTDKDGACAGLIEWLDSALVYQKKGAVGLLKYAATISAGGIANPQTSAGIHTGDSMDIDSNTGDQGANVDLPNVATPYQPKWGVNDSSAAALTDTATVQLTVALRILALVSSHPGMAAVLYGEGALGIAHSVLHHCATALTTSSTDYDVMVDEEVEDDVEELANQRKERFVLRLLLPTLTFLLTLCRSLKAAVQDYQNTKLVDVLLSLHQSISVRCGTYAAVPPHSWSGITQELIATHHVLASVIVCWPIFGWTPALFPRLLGANNSSTASSSILLPMEPAKTCSVLFLLADMLPQESPQTCNNKTALAEMYRSLTVGNILGVQSAMAVSWHAQSPYAEKLLRALSPHIDQIAEIILHHTPTICGVLQGMLKLFVIRLACKNMDHAAVIVRPILNQIREQGSVNVAGSGKESFQVERLMQMVAGLSLHPATKQVLLREGAVEVLVNFCKSQVQFLTGERASSAPEGDATSMGWCQWTMRAFATFCDPDVSMKPSDSLGRRIRSDCPSFGDCCSIASCLLMALRGLPFVKEIEYVLEAFGKLSSHGLGRAAIAYTTVPSQDHTAVIEDGNADIRKFPAVNSDASLSPMSLTPEIPVTPAFVDLWQRILTALETEQPAGAFVTNIIRHSALCALILSAAGKSACGVGALKSLFGIGLGPQTENSGEENLRPVLDIIAFVQQYASNDPSDRLPEKSALLMSASQETLSAQMSVLRILKRPEPVADLTVKVQEIAQKYSSPQTAGKVLSGVKVPQHASVLTALVPFKENADEENDMPSLDDTLSVKDFETSSVDTRGRLVWECSMIAQDRPILANSTSKRKTIAMLDVGRKRYRMDLPASTPGAEGTPGGATPNAGRAVPVSAAAVTLLSRRDTFRQRKPNTSRPPSMHVDDYVARERSSDIIPTGSSPAPVQRPTSGSGRPPSIHVDEFMARQQERQQFSATGNNKSDLQAIGRNLSFPSVDSGRKEAADVEVKVSEDDSPGLMHQSGIASHGPPHGTKDDSLRHELSVVESAAVGPSISTEMPEVSSSADDIKTEKIPSSASSMSTATDSNQDHKTPQVADMMLLQSKVTLQASVSHSAGGSSGNRMEEGAQAGDEHVRITVTASSAMQTISGSGQGLLPLLVNLRGPDLQSSSRVSLDGQKHEASQSAQRTSEFHDPRQASIFSPQRLTPNNFEVLVSSTTEYGGTGHSSHAPTRSADPQPSIVPIPSIPLDSQGRPINLASLVRDVRHLLPTSGQSAREHNSSPGTPLTHNVHETQSNSQQAPSAVTPQRLNSPQVNPVSRGVPLRDHRAHTSASASDPRLGSFSDSSSQATDPRPRPPDMLREKKVTEIAATSVQPLPPPPSPWSATDSGQRQDIVAAPLSMLSPRPSPPTYNPLLNSGAPRASVDAAGVGVPLPQAPLSPWSGQFPSARFFEEAGISYGTPGRPSQAQPPLPVGQSPVAVHGAIQGVGNLPSPVPLQHALNAGTMENRPGSSISGPQVPSNDRRYPVPLQSYTLMTPPLQPTGYMPPPVPAGRPNTSQVPVNLSHQQLMQLQQQNIVQQQLQQQQQQQMQQQHHQQQMQQQQQLQLQQQQQQIQLQQQQQQLKQQQLQQQQLQQQLQSRQHPLQQHAPPQHLQQVQGPQMPMQMGVQGLVLPPPPPPPPPPLPLPPPPQQQQQQQQQQQMLQQQQRLQQQEPSAFLQQMLASPDAIQALLKDQNKLRELLEQHPKLISLLQEKMSQASTQ